MFASLIESGAFSLLGSKNSFGDNVYHCIARSSNLQLLLLAAAATKDAIHVIAGNARGSSPLMLALEGGGGGDGSALAMELVNTSGAFASGPPLFKFSLFSPPPPFNCHSSTSHISSAFEKLRAKNNKT